MRKLIVEALLVGGVVVEETLEAVATPEEVNLQLETLVDYLTSPPELANLLLERQKASSLQLSRELFIDPKPKPSLSRWVRLAPPILELSKRRVLFPLRHLVSLGELLKLRRTPRYHRRTRDRYLTSVHGLLQFAATFDEHRRRLVDGLTTHSHSGTGQVSYPTRNRFGKIFPILFLVRLWPSAACGFATISSPLLRTCLVN